MNAGSIIAHLKLKADEFNKGINDAKGKMKQTSQAYKKVGGAMVGVGTAMGVGMGMAVKTTASFEKQMSNVGAISQASGKDMEKLTQTAKNLGATTAFSATEAGQGMQYLAMAGYDVDEIISALPSTLNMATAGQVDLATSADIASNVLSGFGLEASKTNDVANVLTKTFTSSNTSLESIGETMAYVAPSAEAVGWSLEEMAGATAKLGDVGIQGSRAGTALRSAITRLSAPTKDGATIMDKYGIKIQDAEGKMLPLSNILGQMNTKFEGLTDTQKASATQMIFGTESMSAMLSLMKDPKGLKEYTEGLENVGNISQKVADEQLDNLSGSVTLLKSAFEGVQIALGEPLIAPIRFLVDMLNNLMTWFNNLSPSVQRFISLFLAISSVLLIVGGGLLVFIGFLPQIISGIQLVIPVVKSLGGAFTWLFTNPIGLLILAIIALVGIFVYLWKTNETFRKKVIEIWNAIKLHLMNAIAILKPYIMEAFNSIKNFVLAVFGYLKAFWQDWGSFIMAYFKYTFDKIKIIAQTVFNIIVTVIRTALQIIKHVFGIFTAIFKGDWEGFWNHVGGLFGSIIEGIVLIFANLISGVVKLFRNFTGHFGNLWNSFWGGIKSSFFRILNSLIQKFVSFPSSVLKSLSNLVGGIKSRVKKAKQWLSELNPFKRHSPSLVDNVLAGVKQIKDTYQSVSGMDISAPSIGGLNAGHLQVDKISGKGSEGKGDTNYNDALVKVDKMEVRNDDDVRKISSELYNLQRNAERAGGR